MNSRIEKLKARRKQLEDLESEILNSVQISNEEMHAWAARELKLLSESMRENWNGDLELLTVRDTTVELSDLPVNSEVIVPQILHPVMVLEESAPNLSLHLDDTIFPSSLADEPSNESAQKVLDAYVAARLARQAAHREDLRRIAIQALKMRPNTQSPLTILSEDDEELPALVSATRERKGGVSLEFDASLLRP